MEGEWARLATRVLKDNVDLVIAEVDGTANPDLDKKYVDGYPTVKLFMYGNEDTCIMSRASGFLVGIL